MACGLAGYVEQTASYSPSNLQHANAIDILPPVDAALLLLLVPNDQSSSSPMVTAWVDVASEVGVRVHAISDRQF